MRISGFSRLHALALSLVVPIAVACGGEDAGMEEGMEEQPGQEQMEMGAAPETAMLSAMGNSGVSGEVQFTREGGMLTVDVSAQGLGGAGEYASHIHEGTCQSPGGVVAPLNSVVVEGSGPGEATTEVDATQIEPGGSYLVMVHNQEGTPVGCAEIPSAVTEM